MRPRGVDEDRSHINAGEDGGECRAGDAESGESEVAVDEDPVEGDVDEVGADQREGDGANAADSLEVAAKSAIDEQGKAPQLRMDTYERLRTATVGSTRGR